MIEEYNSNADRHICNSITNNRNEICFANPFCIDGFGKYTDEDGHSFYRLSIRLRSYNWLLHYDMPKSEVLQIIEELKELIK